MAKVIKISSYIFPIGIIIEVDNANFNPNTFYSNGVWERIKGKVIAGVDENDTDFNTTGKTGGEKHHTQTVAEMPIHNHFVLYNTTADGLATGLVMAARSSASNTTQHNEWGDFGVDTQNRGNGQAFNVMQPYYTAYIWKLVSYN